MAEEIEFLQDIKREAKVGVADIVVRKAKKDKLGRFYQFSNI